MVKTVYYRWSAVLLSHPFSMVLFMENYAIVMKSTEEVQTLGARNVHA